MPLPNNRVIVAIVPVRPGTDLQKIPTIDNALAETINGLYKTEVIRHRGPWENIDQVEFATLDWVDWFNNRRILEPIGYIPSAEYEPMYNQQLEGSSEAA